MTQATGKSDITYDLTSVFYHALKGAEVYEQFIKDAEGGGDKELADFFREVQQQDRQRADRAQMLLAKRVKH